MLSSSMETLEKANKSSLAVEHQCVDNMARFPTLSRKGRFLLKNLAHVRNAYLLASRELGSRIDQLSPASISTIVINSPRPPP